MCIFCDIDFSRVENTLIDETDNFLVLPSVGCLVDGYVLIVSKRHINSMALLSDCEVSEYKCLIRKYRNIFKEIYGDYPIVFEHGSTVSDSSIKASSVEHAHLHIVNHRFKNQDSLLSRENFVLLGDEAISLDKNYIMFVDNDGMCYISYDFHSISQLLRLMIAEDLGIGDMYDWRRDAFVENMESSICKIKTYLNKEK